MNFRTFLNSQILKIVLERRHHIKYYSVKQELFFFQIVCFPTEENLNHEYPKILEFYRENDIQVNINLILIDPLYQNYLENNNVRNRINGYNITTYVYDKILEKDDYNTLIEFCHFISNYDCLSVIMEFTSIIRKQYYNSEHITDYLYITPSNCIVNTNNPLFMPVIEKKLVSFENADNQIEEVVRYYFYRAELLEHLYEEFKFEGYYNHKDKYIIKLLEHKFTNINDFYIKVLSYMKLDPNISAVIISKEFIKDNYQLPLLFEGLYKRMGETYKKQLKIFIRDFMKSEYVSFEVFIKKRVFLILISALHFKYKGDLKKINNSGSSIIFDNVNELRDIVNNFDIDFSGF